MGRILVADDDPDSSDLIARVVTKRGHEVQVAPDGAHDLRDGGLSRNRSTSWRARRMTARVAQAGAGSLLAVMAPFLVAPAESAPGPVPTLVSATVSGSRVVVGTQVVVSGAVTPPRTDPTTVVLEFQTATGWQKVNETSAGPAGDYAMRVPTDWYGQHVLRVVALATETTSEGVSDNQSTTVVPSYEPRGEKSSWDRFTPHARWDPCRTIDYRTNFRLAPRGASKLVKRAFRMVHEATGLQFTRVGSTTKVPYSNGPDSSTHLDYGLVVAWSTPRRTPGLAGSTAALGGSTARRVGDGPWVYAYGGVVVDATQKLPVSGFGKGESSGALLLHELGHVMGLAHAKARSQIMYPTQQSSFLGRYEAGDLTGLHALGAAQGCLS